MSMAGRTAIVTGASSGIGRATSVALAHAGAFVSVTGRNEQGLQETVSRIREKTANASVAAFSGDITNDEDVKRIVKSSVEAFGSHKIDILVNCAGILKGGAVGSTDMANFDANFACNTRAVFCFMTECIPFMERQEGELTSSIINVSSVNGLQSFGGVATYCASKAAVDMLTDCAAVDLAPKRIRCNSVNPGVVITELQKRGGQTDEQYQAFLKRSREVTHPLGRVAEAWEVAEAVFFLADSTKSDFITGAHLPVDGGRRCLGAR